MCRPKTVEIADTTSVQRSGAVLAQKIWAAWSPFPTQLWAIQIHRERALKESGGPEQQLGGGAWAPWPQRRIAPDNAVSNPLSGILIAMSLCFCVAPSGRNCASTIWAEQKQLKTEIRLKMPTPFDTTFEASYRLTNPCGPCYPPDWVKRPIFIAAFQRVIRPAV
jgi:hypothetical protein